MKNLDALKVTTTKKTVEKHFVLFAFSYVFRSILSTPPSKTNVESLVLQFGHCPHRFPGLRTKEDMPCYLGLASR